jgi:hypothetical protein
MLAWNVLGRLGRDYGELNLILSPQYSLENVSCWLCGYIYGTQYALAAGQVMMLVLARHKTICSGWRKLDTWTRI